MTTATSNQLKEMPLAAAPGEIWLFVELHAVENLTTAEIFRLAESVGFPVQELRYRSLPEGLGLYAILHYERREPNSTLESEHVTDAAFEELWSRIQPELTVHFRHNLRRLAEGQ